MDNRQNVVPKYRRHTGSSRRMLSPMHSCEPIYITMRSCRWLFFFHCCRRVCLSIDSYKNAFFNYATSVYFGQGKRKKHHHHKNIAWLLGSSRVYDSIWFTSCENKETKTQRKLPQNCWPPCSCSYLGKFLAYYWLKILLQFNRNPCTHNYFSWSMCN